MASEHTLYLGTRKGLLTMEKTGTFWELKRHSHQGIPVPYAMWDSRTDTLWASLHHGGYRRSTRPDCRGAPGLSQQVGDDPISAPG